MNRQRFHVGQRVKIRSAHGEDPVGIVVQVTYMTAAKMVNRKTGKLMGYVEDVWAYQVALADRSHTTVNDAQLYPVSIPSDMPFEALMQQIQKGPPPA